MASKFLPLILAHLQKHSKTFGKMQTPLDSVWVNLNKIKELEGGFYLLYVLYCRWKRSFTLLIASFKAGFWQKNKVCDKTDLCHRKTTVFFYVICLSMKERGQINQSLSLCHDYVSGHCCQHVVKQGHRFDAFCGTSLRDIPAILHLKLVSSGVVSLLLNVFVSLLQIKIASS